MDVDETEESAALLGRISSIMGDFNLLEDLFLEILLRLPVKSLKKFRCVSKSWNEFLKSPAFITKHLKFQAQRKDRQQLIAHIQCATKQFLAVIPQNPQDGVDDYKVLNVPSFGGADVVFEFVSCDGLIFVGRFSDYFNLYLWNPATREFAELLERPRLIIKNMVFGFGVNPNTRDYNVVLLPPGDTNKKKEVDVEIYSKNLGTWSKMRAILGSKVHAPPSTVTTNGAIHWTGYKAIQGRDCPVIVCFDLKDKMLKDINLPSSCIGENNSPLTWKLATMGDSLGIIVTKFSTIDVWEMKHYGVETSWSTRATVRFDQITYDIVPLVAINWVEFRSNNGEIVVGEKREGYRKFDYVLSSKDPESWELKELLVLKNQCVSNVQCYIESLVSVPQRKLVPVPQRKWQRKA